MCYVEIIYTLCSSWTGALVCVDEVNTGASILTGLWLAFIDLFGAVYPVVPRDTLTDTKTIRHRNNLLLYYITILYQSSRLPCFFIRFISIYLTTVASQIISTCGTILARIGWALVHLFLAITPSVAGLASTIMCVSCIQTLAWVSAEVSHVYTWLQERVNRLYWLHLGLSNPCLI